MSGVGLLEEVIFETQSTIKYWQLFRGRQLIHIKGI